VQYAPVRFIRLPLKGRSLQWDIGGAARIGGDAVGRCRSDLAVAPHIELHRA
jgi:hypothetical protein